MTASRKTLDDLLADARARIMRLEPHETLAALERGVRLIDIRSDVDRERDGIVPGSLHIPRTVLEWRLDPDSTWRSPYAGGLADEVVLICDHGYSSSLAAAALVDLGFERAGDVVGGFEAWCDAGLPTAPAPRTSARRGLPGMGSPDLAG